MLTILTQSVGYSLTPLSSKAPARMRTAVMSFDQEAFIAESKDIYGYPRACVPIDAALPCLSLTPARPRACEREHKNKSNRLSPCRQARRARRYCGEREELW